MTNQEIVELADSLKVLVTLSRKLEALVREQDDLKDKDRVIHLDLTAWEIALIVGMLNQALGGA